jgi:hypothetical protein
VAFVFATATISAAAQEATAPAAETVNPDPRVFLSTMVPVRMPALLPGRLIRVIEDPNLRDHWLLCRNLDHPGGPGRLLLVTANRPVSGSILPEGAPGADAVAAFKDAARLAIRAGDRLVVEENSAVAEARLGAVALESAAVGSAFHARMEIGGRELRVVAVASGRATFQPEDGAGR